MQHSEEEFTGAGNAHIYFQTWLPNRSPRALLVIVHGAAEHSGRYERFAEHFVQFGFGATALDHIGHGRSSGTPGHIRNFGDYVDTLDRFCDLLQERYPGVPLVLLGHSMGGLISTCYLLQNQNAFAGCILSGPALITELEPPWWQRMMIQFFATFAPRLGVLQLDSSGVSRDPLEVQKYLDDPLVYGGKLSARKVSQLFAAMQWAQEQVADIRIPMLLLHGGEDKLTSASGSQFLYDNISSEDKTLKIYPGLYHEIFNEPERLTVFADIEIWLGARLERRRDDRDSEDTGGSSSRETDSA